MRPLRGAWRFCSPATTTSTAMRVSCARRSSVSRRTWP